MSLKNLKNIKIYNLKLITNKRIDIKFLSLKQGKYVQFLITFSITCRKNLYKN